MRLKEGISGRLAGVLTIMAGLLLGGCALTPPSSEALIFQKKPPKKEAESGPLFSPPAPSFQQMGNESNFRTFQGPLDIFLSATARPAINGELAYAKKEFAPFIEETLANDSTLTENDLKIRNPYYLSIASAITIINNGKVRWAFNFGIPVVGTDVTTNLSPRTFLTANIGFGDGELIIQRKVIHTEHLGMAIGGYYRAERRGFEIENDERSLVILFPIYDALDPDRIFYNHIVGGRIYGYLGRPSSSIQLRVAPGYAINLKKPIFNISVSIGFNSSR